MRRSGFAGRAHCILTGRIADRLKLARFEVLSRVTPNQVLVRANTDADTVVIREAIRRPAKRGGRRSIATAASLPDQRCSKARFELGMRLVTRFADPSDAFIDAGREAREC